MSNTCFELRIYGAGSAYYSVWTGPDRYCVHGEREDVGLRAALDHVLPGAGV